MKIYYSNLGTIQSSLLPSIGILISYFGTKVLKVPTFCNSLFLDSGAYSAWRKKIFISIENYINFVWENKSKIDIYASLDDITSYKSSLDNYNSMLLSGLNPLPCFHYGEPFWVLDQYLKTTDYVALGGVANKNTTERIGWFDSIFSNYPDIHFHGFGIQQRVILRRYFWHSVDSSSVHVMSRFGGICTPWGDFKINPEVHYKDLKWITPMTEEKIKEWVIQNGVDYDRAKESTPLGTELRSVINVKYYEQLSRKIKGGTQFLPSFNLI